MVDLLPRLSNSEELRARSEELAVDLLVFDGVRTPFMDQLEKAGINVYHLGVECSVYNPLFIFKLIPILRRYDIIHTHNTACQLFVAIANVFVGTRIVTTEHNTTNRRRGRWYLKLGDLWMYRQYQKIICISEQAQKNLVDYLGDSVKITTIYNGIDFSRFSDAKPYPPKDKNVKVITMVSAFRAQKDHKTLISAFDRLPIQYHLQLVGDGELKQEIESFAKQLPCSERIDFLGNRNDIPEILKSSDAVVLSSHYEGLSLSSLEGMASGRPFIASDVEGLHEIVNGYGILVPHEDPVALADAIRNVCEDAEFAKMIANQCQERARQFDISRMAEKYNEVYIQK